MNDTAVSDLHIGLDLDHTVFDPAPTTCETIKQRHGIDYSPEDLTEYNFVLPGTGGVMYESVIMELYDDPETVRDMDIIPGAAEAVRTLHEAGATISVITHRPPKTFDWSRDALDTHDIPYDNFVENVPDQKVDADIDMDVLIDDSPDQVSGMAERRSHGILFLRPHNQDSIPGHANVHIPTRKQDEITVTVTSPEQQWSTITALLTDSTTKASQTVSAHA